MNVPLFLQTLEIMLYGMIGILIVMGVIYGAIALLGYISGKMPHKDQ